jgi:protein-S-isoprenylcysteine O-methyltransferase Ste14
MFWEKHNLFCLFFSLFLVLCVAAVYLVAYAQLNARSHGEQRQKGNRFGKHFKLIYKILVPLSFLLCLKSIFLQEEFVGWYFSESVRSTGFLIMVLGAGLFLLSLRYLGKEYSPCYDSLLPQRIIKSGPYAFIRHPIYTANLSTILGAFLISGSLIIVIVFGVVAFFYVKAAILEEAELLLAHQDYSVYKRTTKMFIPFVF